MCAKTSIRPFIIVPIGSVDKRFYNIPREAGRKLFLELHRKRPGEGRSDVVTLARLVQRCVPELR